MTILEQGHAHDRSDMLQAYVSQLTGVWPDVKFSRTYLAHHELESVNNNNIIIIHIVSM